jgi:hypothetical protein
MKPDFLALLSSDSSRATADITLEAVADNADYFAEIWQIAMSSKPPMNWRAARIIYFCLEKYPALFEPYANETAQKFPNFTNDGMKRGFALALSYAVPYLNMQSIEILVEDSFIKLLSDEKIAVKYNVSKLLFEICTLLPDLKGELQAAIEFNISSGVFRYNGDMMKILKAIR